MGYLQPGQNHRRQFCRRTSQRVSLITDCCDKQVTGYRPANQMTANLQHGGNIIVMKFISVFVLAMVPLLAQQKSIASEGLPLLAPDIQLKDISLVTLNLERAKLLIDLRVNNPNSSDIVVESIVYRLILNNTEVNQGRIEQTERFNAHSARSVKVPVILAYDQHLPAILNALNSAESPTYEISGSITLQGYKKPLPFQHKDTLVICVQC